MNIHDERRRHAQDQANRVITARVDALAKRDREFADLINRQVEADLIEWATKPWWKRILQSIRRRILP